MVEPYTSGKEGLKSAEGLDGVDEELLLAVEHRDADEEQDDRTKGAKAKCSPRELTCAVGSVFEGLDDGCHRVEQHDLMQRRIGHITQGIDDRRSVHPEGDKDAEEVRQVTVFGRERRDDQSETQGEALNQEYEHREKEQVPVGVQVHSFEHKEEINDDEGQELQRETKHLRDNYRNR